MLTISWAQAEPSAPRNLADATNPAGSQFNFGYVDRMVREFAGTSVAPVFMVSYAPPWAEQPGGPASLEAAGAWEPDATAFGQFATALARRYSGSYPDPLHRGLVLPRVRYFQAWAEANFSIHLAPQWTKKGGRWVPAAPQIYRGLLNSFYAGVKAVHPDNLVITTGFAPYGDPAGPCSNHASGNGCRMPPALFAREMLCLHGHALTPESCPTPAHFDVLAMDPYEVGPPTTPALSADDASAPDLGKMTRIVNAAVALGRALPRSHKRLWVTEFSYDSNPPNPTAVSLATQARWLEESFFVFWREGVDTVFWYLVRDQAGKDYNTSYFSGVYFFNGQPKPSLEAYRFPLVVMPSGHSATVWGIAPRGGRVAVERQSGRSWKTLFRIRDSAGGVFVRKISSRLRGNFRAVVGGEASLVWRR